MDEKEFTASDFIPKDLLEIISILERGKMHHSYKIIHNRNHSKLIAKFPARNGEPTPLKTNASVQQTASHQEKKRVSSEDKLSSRKRKQGKKDSSPHASGIKPASQGTEKKLDVSSDVRLTEQPKLEKNKPQLKWQGIVVGGKLSGNELNSPES